MPLGVSAAAKDHLSTSRPTSSLGAKNKFHNENPSRCHFFLHLTKFPWTPCLDHLHTPLHSCRRWEVLFVFAGCLWFLNFQGALTRVQRLCTNTASTMQQKASPCGELLCVCGFSCQLPKTVFDVTRFTKAAHMSKLQILRDYNFEDMYFKC